MIDEGNALEEQGRTTEAMARYNAAVQADPQCARAHLNRGNLLLAGGKFEEARSAYQLAITCDPRYAGAHFNLGNLHFRAGELERALPHYQAAVGIKPDFADAFVAMGNVLDSLGRPAEAMASYERALAINPGYAEVHFNLAVLATNQGRLPEAAASLRRAIEVRPDFVVAYRTLAAVLRSLGDTDAAEAALRSARAVDPEAVQVLYDLAVILQSRGKYEEAAQLFAQVLERAPQPLTKLAFAGCAMRTWFTSDDPLVRAALTLAITEAWVMPFQLGRPALTLILLDERIAGCVRRANEAWPERPSKAALLGADGLAALNAKHLLRALLEAVPVALVEFERFLTCTRHALLEIASSAQAPDSADLAALPFYAALARQCFINEYVFDCTERELLAAADCRARLLALLNANEPVPPLLLLAVAAYFPLHTLRDADRLLSGIPPGDVYEVVRQQVREPLEERALRPGVKSLTEVTTGVSERVREQYEQSPYPRWVKIPRNGMAVHFNAELRRTLPFASFTPMSDDSAPQLLVAGCGTGSHSILAAQRFLGLQVLAIDLSLSSLCYAKRKTQELGITNIEYAHADILKLGELARTFDIIESVGVLHHLADPFAGWRTLLSLLRPGGFMTLGFYSAVATPHLIKLREFIAARGYAGTPDDIRRFRRDVLATGASVELHRLTHTQDFYSTSECRDLLFHVQEHRLTLDQIGAFIAEAGLHFLGFELDRDILERYRAHFPDDPSATNLRNWERFEADNPEIFAGMYRFWIQKPQG